MTRSWLRTLLTISVVPALAAGAGLAAWAQGDSLRVPLAAPLKARQGMVSVPALSPQAAGG